MTSEDLNKAAFGIQAIAERAGMVGFTCAFVYRDEANPNNLMGGGFSTLPTLAGDDDNVRNALRSVVDGLLATAKENLWKAYDQRIEAMVLEKAKAKSEELLASSPADPTKPDPALAND